MRRARSGAGAAHLRILPAERGAAVPAPAAVVDRDAARARIRLEAKLLDAVDEAVMATDLAGRIVYWNRSAERMYGWTADEVLERNVLDVTPAPAVLEQARAIMDSMSRGESWAGEFEVQRKDGTTFVVAVNNQPIHDDDGRLVGIVGISADLTERRRLEAELRHAQKLESVARLAGGVAHDFNNVVTAITGFSDFLLEGLGPDHPLRDDAVEIRIAAERAGSLARQMLGVSRRQALEPQVLDASRVVKDIERLIRRLIGETVEFSIVCTAPDAHVRADRGLLEQVLLNLVVNAADAVSSDGSVIIRVDVVDLDTPRLSLRTGPYVRVTIADDGTGIPPDVLPRIFEPFFTTKPPGRGTGLGLSTAHGIVMQAGGAIDVATSPCGTTFDVYLPRVDGVPAAPTDAAARPPAGGRGETVLIVEDDDAVRRIARRSLERAGYVVLDAARPTEALFRVIPNHGGTIDLLLTDVVLPGMSGPALAREVQLRFPDVLVLLMSGYQPEQIVEHARIDELDDSTILVKPFTLDRLQATIREVLDRPAAR